MNTQCSHQTFRGNAYPHYDTKLYDTNILHETKDQTWLATILTIIETVQFVMYN